MKFSLRSEHIRELALLVIISLIVVFFGSQIPRYYSAGTFERIADNVAIVAVVAVGMTLVVITRNIDLSVGSIVGLVAFVIGRQLTDYPDMSPLVAVGLAMLIGLILGLVNGLIVAYGRVPAIVATLGTLAIYRGYLFAYSNSSHIVTQNLPSWIVELPSKSLFAIGEVDFSPLLVIALVVAVIFQLATQVLPSARRLYAIGSDPETARTSGLPSRRLIMLAFTICGALSGLAGFMYLAKFGTITTVAAQGLELDVVTAVVLGGVNIFGGSGRIVGAMLGAILIGTIEHGLIRMRINEFWKLALQGLAILIAIASDAILVTRIRNWLADRVRKTAITEQKQG